MPVLLVIFVGAAVTGLAIYGAVLEKQRCEERASVTGRNVARLLESTLSRSFDGIDRSLHGVSRYHREQAAHGRVDPARLEALLEQLQSAQPELQDLRVFDAQGMVRLGRRPDRDTPVGIAELDYFRRLRDEPGAGLVSSRPFFERGRGKSGIVLARRISTPDGAFAGIVSATLNSDTFERVLAGVDLGPHGIATLRAADLSLVYRHPAPPDLESLVGDRRVAPQLRALIEARVKDASFFARSLDGRERAGTVFRLGEHPFFIITGVAAEDYLDDWWRSLARLGSFTLIFVLAAGWAAWRLFRAARHLRDAESRWHFALEGSAQGVWDWDIPGGTVYVSPQYKRLLGDDSAEMRNAEQEWWGRVDPDDREGACAACERHFRGETPIFLSEFGMRHGDGRRLWMQGRGMLVERTPDGRPKRMIGTLTDMSERRAMETEIRCLNAALERKVDERTAELGEALARLELAADAAHLGIWAWNFADDRLVWDEKMLRLYEIPDAARASAEYARLWRERLHPDDRRRIRRSLAEARHRHTNWSTVFRLLLPGGAVRYIHAAAVLQFDSEGRALGMVGIHRDITHERELETRLTEARDAAEAASRAKGEFLSNMSHEIRTPLNTILGLASVMLECEHSERQGEHLQRILLAGSVLLGIINDVLDYSKIEAGRMQMEAVPLRVAELLEQCRGLFALQAREKHLALDFVLASDVPPVVLGDPLRLLQILGNLVGNALKFTHHGRVGVAVQCLEADAQQVRLKFAVRDSGIGLTAAQQESLFTAFHQADASTTRKYGGSGLGLSIAKRLVELMGGEIGVDSVAGEGSIFWFTVRLAMAPPATAPAGGTRRADEAMPGGFGEAGQSSLRPVDEATLSPLLQTLARQLAGGQAGARQSSRTIEALVAGSELQAAYTPVASAVGRFDFPGALDELRKLMEDRGFGLL